MMPLRTMVSAPLPARQSTCVWTSSLALIIASMSEHCPSAAIAGLGLVTVRVAAPTSDDAKTISTIAVPNNRNFMGSPAYVVIIGIFLYQPWYKEMLFLTIFINPYRHSVIDMRQ